MVLRERNADTLGGGTVMEATDSVSRRRVAWMLYACGTVIS